MDASNQPTTNPAILEVADVARLYKISRTRQWTLRKSGDLPYRQDPGSSRVYYMPDDIAEYLNSIRRGGQKLAA